MWSIMFHHVQHTLKETGLSQHTPPLTYMYDECTISCSKMVYTNLKNDYRKLLSKKMPFLSRKIPNFNRRWRTSTEDEELQQKDEELQQKDALLGQKDEELQQKDEELQQKDEELQQKDEELQQKDALLGQKDEELQQKDEELALLRSQQTVKPSPEAKVRFCSAGLAVTQHYVSACTTCRYQLHRATICNIYCVGGSKVPPTQ